MALPLVYLEPAQAAYWVPDRTLAPDGSGALLGADGRPVAWVSVELLPRVAVELANAGGVTPLRLFRWALREVTAALRLGLRAWGSKVGRRASPIQCAPPCLPTLALVTPRCARAPCQKHARWRAIRRRTNRRARGGAV